MYVGKKLKKLPKNGIIKMQIYLHSHKVHKKHIGGEIHVEICL
jgi:hypothetical protein